MKPSDFTVEPWSCIFMNKESEVIARNIMQILKRTGNAWRELSWEEYKEERLKDGNFTEREKSYFDKVLPYTVSEQQARKFSPTWHKVIALQTT